MSNENFGIGITPPKVGDQVSAKSKIINTSTKSNIPVDSIGLDHPWLYETGKSWEAGTTLKVLRVALFHDHSWKVIVGDDEGNMAWVMPWQISY